MALVPLITTDEFGVWLGRTFAAEELARVTMIIGAASTRVRKFAGETYVDEEGGLVEDIDDAITDVVKLVAARVWNNPRAVVTQGAGPFSETLSNEATELLKLTETEEQLITSTLDTPSPGLWALGTTRGPLETHQCGTSDLVDTVYADGPGEPFMFGPETME